jgi:hypothetical protein
VPCCREDWQWAPGRADCALALTAVLTITGLVTYSASRVGLAKFHD